MLAFAESSPQLKNPPLFFCTVNALGLAAVPPGVVTETSLAPRVAEPSMLMLAVIWVALSTVKVHVMPEPNVTAVAPVRYVPVMVTVWVWP